jgi:hypothetical protein
LERPESADAPDREDAAVAADPAVRALFADAALQPAFVPVLTRTFFSLQRPWAPTAIAAATSVAASAAPAFVSHGIWDALDQVLGRGTLGQVISLGTGLALAGLVYLGAAKLLRIAELAQVVRPLRRG